jgi:hypothetical protein
MLQPNRSFWSFISKNSIQRYYVGAPKAFVEAMYALVIEINAAPPRTPITAVWDTNLPNYEEDPDDRHLVSYTDACFSPKEYGSFTAWRRH